MTQKSFLGSYSHIILHSDHRYTTVSDSDHLKRLTDDGTIKDGDKVITLTLDTVRMARVETKTIIE